MKARARYSSLMVLFLLGWQGLCLGAESRALVDGEGYVRSDGVRIWYRIEGAGRAGLPLLMIHGGPGATARPFERSIGPQIAVSRPVIYMDYRGAGRSDRPQEPEAYSFAILARDAEAIRKALGVPKWAVFGHSNGAATAMTYASAFPSVTAGLILCDPLLSPVDLDMNLLHKVLSAPDEAAARARSIYKSEASGEEKFMGLLDLIDPQTRDHLQFHDAANSARLGQWQAELSGEIGKGLMDAALIEGLLASGFFGFDAYKMAEALTMPVQLIVGRYDTEISLENSIRFAVAVRDGALKVMESSGHHPYIEETRECTDAVNAFIEGLNDRPP